MIVITVQNFEKLEVFMKNTKLLLAMLGMVLALGIIGCSNPASQNAPGGIGGNEGDQGPLAKVVIPLPSTGSPQASLARGVGLTESKTNTNYYEVTFKRTDTSSAQYYSASATTAEGQIELAFPAGTYDAVLFAGYSRLGYYTPILLATSSVAGNIIVLGGTNTITMELSLVDFSFTAPDSAEADTLIPISATANLSSFVYNPSISISLTSYGGSTSGSRSNIGTVYTWSYTSVKAPTTPQNVGLSFSGSCYPFTNSRTQWYLASISSTYITDSTLIEYYRKTIAVGSPDIGIVITWPDE
jgi:hypothetical protein